MTDYPTNVTASEVDASWVNIEDRAHAEIETNLCATCLSHNTLGLTSGARGVQNVERVL